jgi:hypothetical protein
MLLLLLPAALKTAMLLMLHLSQQAEASSRHHTLP